MPGTLIPTDLFFENVRAALAEKKPFAVYREPFKDRVKGFFPRDGGLHFVKDYTETGFVFAPFESGRGAVIFHEAQCRVYACEGPVEGVWGTSDEKSGEARDSESQRQNHIRLVKAAMDFIHEGKAMKIVVSRQEVTAVGDVCPEEMLRRLLQRYPSAFAYLWYHPEVGLWAGASPETLLGVAVDRFETMALAGTQIYRGTMDVSWGDKEAEEQKMVTDHILAEMEGVNLVQKGPYTLRAGGLLHLCTEISGEIGEGQGLGYLIGRLHPTAAVCGLPRSNARDFIRDNEGYDREFYTGFLGELNLDGKTFGSTEGEGQCSSSLFVNLRCMRLEGPDFDRATIFVGGGITASSIPEREWEETTAKAEVMKSIFRGKDRK